MENDPPPSAPRLLRADVEEFDTDPPPLSRRRQAQRDRIHRLATLLFARRGAASITLPNLALALDLTTACLRRHVIDLNFLLFTLLRGHLQSVRAAIAEIPETVPDCRARRTAAYLAATRQNDRPTPIHAVLLRDRDTLPPDLLELINELHAAIGTEIAGPLGDETLELLDSAASGAAQLCQAAEDLSPTLNPPPAAPPEAPKPVPVFDPAALAALTGPQISALVRALHPGASPPKSSSPRTSVAA